MKKTFFGYVKDLRQAHGNVWVTSLVVILFVCSIVTLNATTQLRGQQGSAAFLRTTSPYSSLFSGSFNGVTTGSQNTDTNYYNQSQTGGNNTGCTYRTPTVSVNQYSLGTVIPIANSSSRSFVIKVKNNDSISCPSSHFDITQSVNDPDHKSTIINWIISASSPSWLSLAPGEEKTTTITVDPYNAKARDYKYSVSAFHGNSTTGENYCDFIGRAEISVRVPTPGGDGTGGGSTVPSESSGCSTNTSTSDQTTQQATCVASIDRSDVVTEFKLNNGDCPLDSKTSTNPTPDHSFTITWKVNDAKVTHVLNGAFAGQQACIVRGSGITGSMGRDNSATNGNSNTISVTIPSYQQSAIYRLTCDLSETPSEENVEVASICVAEQSAQCGTSFNIGNQTSSQTGGGQTSSPPAGGTQSRTITPTTTTPPTQKQTTSFLDKFIRGELFNFSFR